MKTLLFLVFCATPLWAVPVNQMVVPLMNVGGRIINGSAAKKGDFPWQVAVISTLTNGRQSFCGGSLIHRQWVLTAAHCAIDTQSFTLHFGTNTVPEPDSESTTVTTTTKIVHAQYNPNTLVNDVALIKLPSPITTNNYIQVIPIATNTLGSGVAVTVSGWGKISDAATGVSNTLNYVGLSSITNNACSSYYGNLGSGIVCASGSGKSTCNGDSGGPLVTGSGSNAQLVGVVSFVSSRGCESGYPSGYSRAQAYRSWITQNAGISL